MKFARLGISLPFLVALSSAAPVATDSPRAPEAVDLDPIVVTATRQERDPWSTPAALVVLGGDELRLHRAVRSTPEALKNQPGVMVQKTGHGQGSPYIRGFTGFRSLFLIDGIRLNNSVFRDGPNQYWNTVDALSLGRLELARGPFSVLYGSDAIGGVVKAVTRGADDLAPDVEWNRRLYYRFADAERSHVGRIESIGYLSDSLVLTAGYSAKHFGDLEGGDDVGRQRKTGYDERDWDAKLEFFPDADTTIVVAHQGVDVDDAWRTHKTIFGTDWRGLEVGSELRRVLDQDRALTYLQASRDNLDGFADAVQAGVSHQRQKESRDRLRSGDRHDVQGFEVDTVGAFVQLQKAGEHGDWVYGVEVYHDDVDSFSHKLAADGSISSVAIQGPVGDDATYDTVGVYVQDEIPAAENLTLILGARYEYADADADSVSDPLSGERISVSDNWDALVGSARALYALDADGACNLFAGISQGFRAPNLSDLTRLDSARTDEIETPSPDLDPEKFVAYELGLKARNAALSLEAAYFYTDIEDMIVRAPTGRVIDDEREVTKRNASGGYVQGVEVAAEWRVGDELTAFGTLTWVDGEVATFPTSDPVAVDEPLDRLMPTTGRAGLRWASGPYWAEAACTVADDADELSTRDRSDTSRIPEGGTAGYTTWDLRGGWQATDGLSISLAVENIADEDYRVHGSGVNEAGRNVVIATEYVF